jgi:transmembrane sensor
MEEAYLKRIVKRYLEKRSTDEELEIFVYLMKQGKLDKYIREAMDADIDLQKEPVPQRKSILARLGWPVAAAVAITIGAFSYTSIYKFNPQPLAKVSTIRFKNFSSSIQKQVLPDGSTVWLNPHTELSYPSAFGKLREVKMQGEAFFEVTKDHAHPFVVSSGNVLTKVWGTSFRIRSIPGDNNTSVSVLSGKVSVSVPPASDTRNVLKDRNREEVMLLPQEEATYKPADHHLLKSAVPATSDLIVWRKANLSFENTSLAAIAMELNKFYHIQLQVEGEELQKSKLTADFTDKNLADILLLICKSLHAGYSKTDSGIILRTTILLPISTN